MNSFRNVLLPVCSLTFAVIAFISMNMWQTDLPEDIEVLKIVKENYGSQYGAIDSVCRPDKQIKQIRCDYTLVTHNLDGSSSHKPSYGLFKRRGEGWEALLY